MLRGGLGTASIALAALAAFAAAPLFAQVPRMNSRDAAAVAESLAVLRELDTRVQRTPADHAAWFHQGMLAWTLTLASRDSAPPRGVDGTRLGRLADTSLRIAAQLAPDESRYHLAVGQFLLGSGNGLTRFSAIAHFEAAYEAARRRGVASEVAVAALELGRLHWRRYERVADRREESHQGTAPRSLSDAMCPLARWGSGCSPGEGLSLSEVRTIIETSTIPLAREVNGESDMHRALELFREAYQADPVGPWTFRSVAMVLAERTAWLELADVARRHLERRRWDAIAWMALGLALQRHGDGDAAAAFDTATTYLSSSERRRLDNINRVLPRARVDRAAAMSGGERADFNQLYWLLADPKWTDGKRDAHTEFIARVTYAELRWSVPELGVSGADTDRGDIYIRYGPPDTRVAFGPVVAGGSMTYNLELLGAVPTVWLYDASGLIFMFNGMPMHSTAFTPRADVLLISIVKDAYPVRWDNVAIGKVDSLPSRVARFRAHRDSVDLHVSVAATAHNAAGGVSGGLWILSPGGRTEYSDTSTLRSMTHAWTTRVGAGAHVARAEVANRDGSALSRATFTIEGGAPSFATRGFGMSDVLMAERIVQDDVRANTWRDVPIAPTAGVVSSQVALVWETYELTNVAGSANYSIAVTITADRSLLEQISRRVISAIPGARIDQRSDRVVIALDRTVPYAPRIVDHLTVDLAEAPSGKYSLSVEVTDRANGRKVTRTQPFVVRDK